MTSATPDESTIGNQTCQPGATEPGNFDSNTLPIRSTVAEQRPLPTRPSTESPPFKRTSRRHLLRRFATILIACLILVQFTGCGGGVDSFTNGGIPEGRSVISVRVVASNNPTVVLPGVSVTVYDAPQGESTATYGRLTDSNGEFTLNIPTGLRQKNAPPTVSSVTVAVKTAPNGYQTQKVSFLLTDSQPVSVVLALPPTGFDFTQVGSVSVTSNASSVNPPAPNIPFAFTAELLGTNGQPLVSSTTSQVYVPSLVLQNLSLISIGNNGTFEAVGSTSGVTTSIMGTVSFPNAQPPINSTPIELTVTTPQTVITGSTQEIGGAPSPPGIP